MKIEKIKKELKKELTRLNDKVKFGKFDGRKLMAEINGRKVYYIIENGELATPWYYPAK